jgi:hypothetical protein
LDVLMRDTPTLISLPVLLNAPGDIKETVP